MMKMKKRFKALITAAVVCTSVLMMPLTANARLDFSHENRTEEESAALQALCESGETAITEDGLWGYKVTRDPLLCTRVCEYYGNGGDILVPDIYGKCRISFSDLDFSGKENITSITYAGASAWLHVSGDCSDCTNLESLVINQGVSDEFMSVYFPDGISPEDEDMWPTAVWGSFENCTSLKKVSLPENENNILVSEIGKYVFKNCISLPEITLKGYWRVEEGAFLGCTALKKVIFNENVQEIGDYAFGYTENEDGTFSRYEGLTIYGVAGTAAETYAVENDIPFVSIEKEPVKVHGDLNNDENFNVADVVFLQNWLISSDKTESWIDADFCEDGVINVFDLCIMKRMLSEG
ncbi:MAG: leucine-rich repeat protein [Porcipelethomonas sp.]